MFKNSNEFSLHVETIAKEQKLGYLESVLYYCEKNFIDPEDIVSLINKSLKEKIAQEMIEQNYFPKKATLDL